MDSLGVQAFTDWAQAHLAWAMVAAFAFALLESLAIIGVFIPGIVLLFAVGALVGWDPFALVMVWLAATAGAVAGDGLSYWVGRRFQENLTGMWPFARYPHWLTRGRILFQYHGGKSVFIARFIGPLRPVVPLVAGMLRMELRPFLFFMIPACLLWAPLYLLPGVLFGASLELAAEFGGRLAILLVLLVLGVWLVLWLTRLIYDFSARRGVWWLKGLVRWTRRHPLMARTVGPLFEPGQREVISVAFLGLLLLVSLAALLAALSLAPLATPAWDAERQVATLAASLRSHFADPLFVVISLAGEIEVVALTAAICLLVLIALGRRNAAAHWLMATAGAWLLAELLNGFMGLILDRPEALEALGEVPHTGYTLTTAMFGFFSVMLAKDLKPRRRKWAYLATVFILTLIGFAHFYLGRAALLGLIAGLAAGGGWLALIGIGYRLRAVRRPGPVVMALGFYGVFVAVAGTQVAGHYRSTLEVSRLAQPVREFDAGAWLREDWSKLPPKRSRVGRMEIQQFDAQLAGNLDVVAERLADAGWRPFPALDSQALAALLSGRREARELPHLHRDFAGRPENLALRRFVNDNEVLLFRAWASGARLQPGDLPVWLVQVRKLERATLAGGFNTWRQVETGRGEAMDALRVAGWDWQWAQPEPDGPWLAVVPAGP